jgi:hypothetical protein
MSFDPEVFRKEFDRALEVASGVKNPTVVEATTLKQAGVEILAAHCPACRTLAALAGPGKHLCRGCGTWLDYRLKE